MPRALIATACASVLCSAVVPIAAASAEARVTWISQAAVLQDARDGVVAIPAPDGRTERFRVEPTRVAAPALERRYPGNRVFNGEGIDDPRARVVLGTGLQGFHAQVISPSGDWFVDRQVGSQYVTYDADARGEADIDQLPPVQVPGTIAALPRAGTASAFPRTSGTELRTYRFALATTGEYSARFGGTKPLVHAELIKAMARINGVYEAEVSAHFELVANNDDLIYLNSATDPFTNNNGSAMLGQNQTTVDAVIGSANYDLGHVFSTGGGGVAYLGVLGVDGYKAGGVTGMSNPTGDSFYIDYVSHEVGHQMGGQHTFQGTTDSCSGNGVSAAAMEPGSGSTIMGYAGICGTDDLQAHSDAYFHAKSYDQIRAVMETASSTGVGSATGNSAPVISLPASSYTVPPRTPLRLAATATDANADAITYGWEQYNAGVLRTLDIEPKTGGALFRSYAPTSSGVRYAPALSSVLAGTTNQATGSCAGFDASAQLDCRAEFLPTGARSMTFRVTARDDSAGGGGVSTADVTVTVSGSTPFALTSHNSPAVVAAGEPLEVTWDTAGTAGAPYNVSGVDILASRDGGSTWEYVLADNATNDGAQAVTLPAGVVGSNVRLMVRGHGSIFYDVNDAALTAEDQSGPGIQIITPAEGAVYTQGEVVAARYTCTDLTSVSYCTGPVADGGQLRTDTPGSFAFAVTAGDGVGNTSRVVHSYTIAAAPDPQPEPPSSAPAQPAPPPTLTPQTFGVDAWVARSLVGQGVVGASQKVTLSVRRGRAAVYALRVTNSGSGLDAVRIAGTGSTRQWRVAYINAAGRDVTRIVTRGGWVAPPGGAGEETQLTVRVTPTARVRRGAHLSRTVTAASTGDRARTDAVTLRTVRR